MAGQPQALIPRVKRLLERTGREARPQLASPNHLLLALITGNEPACEILTTLGVDLNSLATAVRREIDEPKATGERASRASWRSSGGSIRPAVVGKRGAAAGPVESCTTSGDESGARVGAVTQVGEDLLARAR